MRLGVGSRIVDGIGWGTVGNFGCRVDCFHSRIDCHCNLLDCNHLDCSLYPACFLLDSAVAA